MPRTFPLRSVTTIMASLLLAACSAFGIRSGTEEPQFTVVDEIDQIIEIRQYEERVAAQTVVDSSASDDGRNGAFQLLFDYISGANVANEGIAMTAPVAVDRPSKKIAMTAPVETGSASGSETAGVMRMRFFLPAEFTPETAPRPLNAQVEIVSIPAETIAVLRYSGSRNETEARKQQQRLLDALSRSPWQAVGEPTNYFYDPPWTIPFLRRNEAVAQVIKRQASPQES